VAKYTHTCERCGLESHLERTGSFSDNDYRELLAEYFTLELRVKHFKAMLEEERKAHRASMAALIGLEVENNDRFLEEVRARFVEEETGCPF
jgi:hypothetical protein